MDVCKESKECKKFLSEGIEMELAKLTSKGQITVPVAIRRRLNLKTGDKIAFLDAGDRITVVNAKSIEKGEIEIQ